MTFRYRLVSAGFDAAAGDDLGECEVSPAGYAHMTAMLCTLAEGRILVALEVRGEPRNHRHRTELNRGATTSNPSLIQH